MWKTVSLDNGKIRHGRNRQLLFQGSRIRTCVMKPLQLLPSTTSHKHEPLLPTLAIFSLLGMCDLDLNLNHLIEHAVTVHEVQRALDENHQRVWVVSGGWCCDFFDEEPKIQATFCIGGAPGRDGAVCSGSSPSACFLADLEACERYSADARATIVRNIRHVADDYPDILFAFENHDGASSHPEICRQVLESVDRSNVRLTFSTRSTSNTEWASIRWRLPASCNRSSRTSISRATSVAASASSALATST